MTGAGGPIAVLSQGSIPRGAVERAARLEGHGLIPNAGSALIHMEDPGDMAPVARSVYPDENRRPADSENDDDMHG